MPAGPVGREPFYSDRTMAEVIALGERMGCPEISWGVETGGEAYVVYHWSHGDRRIYPRVGSMGSEPYEGKPGDIFLVPMPGFGGLAIRIGQWAAGDGWTKYQHAGVVVGEVDGYEGTRTIEAYPGGAIVGRLDRFDAKKVVWLRCPPAYRDAVAAAALGFRDVPYSALDYDALALHRFHIPARHLKDFIRDQGRMICSQLADASAMKGGWHIFDDDRWEGYVTPNDLGKAARLQAPGGYVERVKVSR